MMHLQYLLMWDKSSKTSSCKEDAFADPLDRPGWQPLFPLLDAYMMLANIKTRNRCPKNE